MGNDQHGRTRETLSDRRCNLGVHPDLISISSTNLEVEAHSKSTEDVAEQTNGISMVIPRR